MAKLKDTSPEVVRERFKNRIKDKKNKELQQEIIDLKGRIKDLNEEIEYLKSLPLNPLLLITYPVEDDETLESIEDKIKNEFSNKVKVK